MVIVINRYVNNTFHHETIKNHKSEQGIIRMSLITKPITYILNSLNLKSSEERVSISYDERIRANTRQQKMQNENHISIALVWGF